MRNFIVITLLIYTALFASSFDSDRAPGDFGAIDNNSVVNPFRYLEGPTDPITWTTKSPSPAVGRYWCPGSGVVRDTIWFCGGRTSAVASINAIVAYIPASDAWVTTGLPTLLTARRAGGGGRIGNKIYVAGGRDAASVNLSSCEEFDVDTKIVTTKAPMPVAYWSVASAVAGGKLYIIGNESYGGTNYEYDPVANTWATKAPIVPGRGWSAAAGAGGKVYVFGGIGTGSIWLSDCWEYDPVANTWTQKASMPGPRGYHQACALNDNEILVMGGSSAGAAADNVVYLYNVASNTWTTEVPMPTARGWQMMNVVGNKMYVTYGSDCTTPTYLTVNEEASFAPLPQKDVGVSAIRAPGGVHIPNTPMTPIGVVKNFGLATQTSFPVVCSIIGTGGAVRYTNTQTVATLAPNDTIRVNFASWTPTIQEIVTVIMRTNLVNDSVPANDRMSRTTQIANFYVYEDFNGTTFPPSGWQAIIGMGTYNWERFTAGTFPTCTPYDPPAMTGYRSYNASSGSWARLISHQFTLTGATECTVKFWMTQDPGYATVQESIIVETSTNGTTFTRVAAFRRYAPAFAWVEQTVYLGNLPAGNNFVAFRALSGFGNNMYMDLVRVTGGPSVPPPANDVGVEVIRAPGASHLVNTSMTPIAVVKNYGTATQTNFPVVCSIVGTGSAVRYTNTKTVASLAAGDTIRVNFDAWTPTISENVTVAMRTNLAGDANPANDRKSRTTLIGMIILQDFEATNGGYIADPPDTCWQWGTPTAVGPSAAYSPVKCWGTKIASNYSNNANWRLTTPRFTATTNNPVLKFWHWYNIETRWDGGNVKMSLNGTDWTLIHPVGGYPDTARSANVAIPRESCYTASMTTWTEATFNLPVNSGQNFWLRWHFGTDGSVASYPGWYFDDVMLIGASLGIEEQNPHQVVITSLNVAKPNPVKGNAHISFNLASPTYASLKIYDASGRIVKTLVNAKMESGVHNLIWNGKDENNRNVAEGIYFYTLETENNSTTKKLVLTR